jgi:VIT1/CCC1 family predicted Fe2+/Mn2+ transporter
VAVLPAAQRCLAVQPIRARRLLATWSLLPLAIVAALIVVVALVLSSNAAVNLVLPAALAILALAGLGMACVAAERRNPRRIGLVFSLHLMALLAVVQALPPIAVLLWSAQMVWLLRRGLIA